MSVWAGFDIPFDTNRSFSSKSENDQTPWFAINMTLHSLSVCYRLLCASRRWLCRWAIYNIVLLQWDVLVGLEWWTLLRAHTNVVCTHFNPGNTDIFVSGHKLNIFEPLFLPIAVLFVCPSFCHTKPALPPIGYIWDVMLVSRKGNIEKSCLCVTVLCTVIMVHKGTSSSYRLVDCIGLWYCLV